MPRARPSANPLIRKKPVATRADFERLVDSWLLGVEAKHRSAQTLRTYRWAVGRFADFLEAEALPFAVEEITRAHIERFLVAVQRAHPGTSTVATIHSCLSPFFNWLCDVEEEIPKNPMRGISTPSVTAKEVPVISDDHVKQLLAVVKQGRGFEERRDHAIFRLLLATPLRRTEVANLRWPEDVDLQSRLLRITAKGNRERSVPFEIKAAQALDRYLRIRAQHSQAGLPWLWLGNRGRFTAEGLYLMLRRRAEQAGLPPGMHPHLFRHKFASTWLEEGGQEVDLMRLGGWRSAEVMRKYGESLAERRAVENYRRLSPGDRY